MIVSSAFTLFLFPLTQVCFPLRTLLFPNTWLSRAIIWLFSPSAVTEYPFTVLLVPSVIIPLPDTRLSLPRIRLAFKRLGSQDSWICAQAAEVQSNTKRGRIMEMFIKGYWVDLKGKVPGCSIFDRIQQKQGRVKYQKGLKLVLVEVGMALISGDRFEIGDSRRAEPEISWCWWWISGCSIDKLFIVNYVLLFYKFHKDQQHKQCKYDSIVLNFRDKCTVLAFQQYHSCQQHKLHLPTTSLTRHQYLILLCLDYVFILTIGALRCCCSSGIDDRVGALLALDEPFVCQMGLGGQLNGSIGISHHELKLGVIHLIQQ